MNTKEAKVMIIGSGGREDALLGELRLSSQVGDIYVAPGNGGSDRFPDTARIQVDIKNVRQTIEAAQDLGVNLVVVGPEEPLVLGIIDELQEVGISGYGPTKAAAQLEGSKAYAVEFMQVEGIPHPESHTFSDFDRAVDFTRQPPWTYKPNSGVVVKADGLAAGKGVFVCAHFDEAYDALRRLMVLEEFGKVGKQVIVQEKLSGYEASVMAIVNGTDYILMPTTEDHKQSLDGDRGKNTGGMGVDAPHPLITPELEREIATHVIDPILYGLQKRGITAKGTLYPGIMVTETGFSVLEINFRFGAPETEAILSLFQGDLYKVFDWVVNGSRRPEVSFNTRSCIVVSLVSGGYPETYQKGLPIYGLDQIHGSDARIYHAGTERNTDGTCKTVGGRVFSIAGLVENREVARNNAYGVIGPHGIHFQKMNYRTYI